MIPMTGLDLETTGTDPEDARIVQYAVVGTTPDLADVQQLVNPGVDVPDEAAAIHGLTTDMVQAEGIPALRAVAEIVAHIAAGVAAGRPLVGHNISYDLTVIDRECRRHLGQGLEELVGAPVRPVVDTVVLSKKVDPYRKRVSETQGAHALRTCVEHLVTPRWPSVVWDEEQAHGARYDCRMSLYVAAAVLSRPALSRHTPESLHDAQVGWRATQCASLQAYFRNPGKAGENHDPHSVVDGRWPIIPAEPRQETLIP
ncbi:exonuclease domain-containing protein [Nocardiopsis sp. CT-R113]|uniref:Exonuclease domain-containing protein n=1 Tax=Nocardiopsis codii TaxID=3065942 RepID=A0ABU7KES1_9ACTN|nr:exonuclease domain-containing protein [Nocardiopsis sp. CT-R113]MEE2040092.1 exonuclease domain-containing protein [Nocardiopsis sp. CT-R113]